MGIDVDAITDLEGFAGVGVRPLQDQASRLWIHESS
jgi:hypothetical protein